MNRILRKRFILNGKEYYLSKEDVVKAIDMVEPEIPQKYYVIINSKKYPPKQIIERTLHIGRSEFTTQAAINILKNKLEFDLYQI